MLAIECASEVFEPLSVCFNQHIMKRPMFPVDSTGYMRSKLYSSIKKILTQFTHKEQGVGYRATLIMLCFIVQRDNGDDVNM